MKKDLTALLLTVLILSVSICGVCAQDPDGTDFNGTNETVLFNGLEAPEEEPLIEYSLEELNVASVNPLNGNFFSSVWGRLTSDIDVQRLLHGYDIVHWDSEGGMFVPDDTVVSGIAVTANADEDEIFTIVLYPDLYYSDGTKITAWDYAFSMLLNIAPEAAEIGGNIKRPEYLLGYEEYINGDVPYLAGFHVIDEEMFSITVKRDYLPFFYAMGLLSCTPCPISEIAPGMEVADDGRGIYLTGINGDGRSLFTAELLEKTILDPETGYLSHPKVTSGPYKLVSFENGRAVFEINEYYKGNELGDVPLIPRITFETLGRDEMIPAFENGQVGLINKLSSSDMILAGIGTVTANNVRLAFTNYPRTGLAFINFNTERPVMNETEVRQALAQLFDKDLFIQETVSNFGLRADGYYGMGQWMYQILSGTIAYPVAEPGPDNDMTDAEYDRQIAEWEKLSLDDIPVIEYDPEDAAKLLSDAGWDLNADGGAFRRGEDAVRCKMIEGELVPLSLNLAYPQGTPAETALIHLAEEAAEEGFVIALTAIPMEELQRQYHGVDERTFDMFFLAVNFDIMFDPSIDFADNEDGIPVWVETGFADRDLYDLAVAMRKTDPGDLLTYCRHWLAYQQRIAETLPVLPLYSNVYFDFYTRALQDYFISSNVTWSEAIVKSYLGYITETPAEEEFGEAPDEFGENDEFVEFEEFDF